ncbi:hypothetical protein TOPH_02521 [Tolypocladium ophioglossoides CBS 100239]|uniref:Uncharacterized protein n=1 Tax=Tolypocladium ophioglossoides (strain CBS 100239) TaxID=1163406 RepID=A0A0L0NEZ3_TOLOC|nr:hypothetical protein TOPH_02521 [Tolypocladium ophioglossoides CBS 100239]
MPQMWQKLSPATLSSFPVVRTTLATIPEYGPSTPSKYRPITSSMLKFLCETTLPAAALSAGISSRRDDLAEGVVDGHLGPGRLLALGSPRARPVCAHRVWAVVDLPRDRVSPAACNLGERQRGQRRGAVP